MSRKTFLMEPIPKEKYPTRKTKHGKYTLVPDYISRAWPDKPHSVTFVDLKGNKRSLGKYDSIDKAKEAAEKHHKSLGEGNTDVREIVRNLVDIKLKHLD
jgi:hypothetical protein